MEYNLKFAYNDNKTKIVRKEVVNKDYLNKKKLTAKVYKNGYILPRKQIGCYPYTGIGGCLNSNREFIQESADFDLPKENDSFKYKFGGSYEFKKYDFLDKKVVYIGLCQMHWGHFLIDSIHRLWYLIENNEDVLVAFSGIDGNDEYTWRNNYLELLNLFGISSDRIIVISNPTMISELIVPEPSIWPGKWYTLEYKSIFEHIIKNAKLRFDIDKKTYDKVYFSRTKIADIQKQEYGENDIEKTFRDIGYKVFYPEQLSLLEQIFIIHNAKSIASLSGTISHQILFAKDGVELIYLSKSSILQYYQFPLNQMKDVNVQWIDVYNEPLRCYPISMGYGPFWIVKSQELVDFLCAESSEKTNIMFKDWKNYLIRCCFSTRKFLINNGKSRLTGFRIYQYFRNKKYRKD